jgi:hypothetical protein
MFCNGTSFKLGPLLLFFCQFGNMPKILITPIFCFILRRIPFFHFVAHNKFYEKRI